jgi:hypothetical protein
MAKKENLKAHQCECGNHVWMPVNRAMTLLVSPQDRELIESERWTADFRKDKSAARHYARSWRAHRIQQESYLHRRLLPGTMPDHRNANGMDNRRENLRPADCSLNSANNRKRKNTTSQFKGVGYFKRDRTWQATLTFRSKCLYLGRFRTELEAAAAYDKAARQHFGDYARPNLTALPEPTTA